MVVIDSINNPLASPAGFVNIPGSSTITVYTVPPGRHLVLTEFATNDPGYMSLQEIVGGVRQPRTRVNGSFNRAGGPGLVFSPGSEVAILNHFSTNTSVVYVLVGYLD